MKLRRLQWVGITLLLSLFGAGAKCDTFTDAMRGDDKRLETPVTITARRILLGALLEGLSKQTGVDIKMDERDEASGVPLTVFCDKAPLGDIMSAVHSLISYRTALWKWERAGKASHYVYELSEPVNTKSYPARLKQQSFEAFQAYAATMLALAHLSPEERKKNVGKIAASLLQKDNTRAVQMLDEKYTWASLNTFSQALSPRMQKQVLLGDRASVVVDQTSPEAQAAFQSAWAALNPKNVAPDGTRTPYPVPTKIGFHGGQSPRKQLTGSLFMDFGGMGSVSFLGGQDLEQGLRSSLREQWMLSGDAANSDIAKQVCRERKASEPLIMMTAAPSAPNALPPSLEPTPPLVQVRFEELARSAPVSVIALLPEDVVFDAGLPYGKTVQTFLDSATRYDLMTKWRNNILLVSYQTWFLYDDGKLPYAVVQQLHRAEQEGFVPALPLAEVCARLTDEQWHELCATTPTLKNMEEARRLLIFCAQNRGVTRSGGIPLTEDTQAALQAALPSDALAVLHKENALALRVAPVKRAGDTYRQYEMQLQYQGADHAWHPFIGYVQERPLPETAK